MLGEEYNKPFPSKTGNLILLIILAKQLNKILYMINCIHVQSYHIVSVFIQNSSPFTLSYIPVDHFEGRDILIVNRSA